MSVYGASATRDRQVWLFGLTGPQFFLVLAAGFPTWMAIAMQQWLALLVLLPLWAVVGLLVCLPIRGHSAIQWIGVVLRHMSGLAFGWSRFQSKIARRCAIRHSPSRRSNLSKLRAPVSVSHGSPSLGKRAKVSM